MSCALLCPSLRHALAFAKLFRCELHRFDNVLIAGAAAQIAGDTPADLLVSRISVLLQQGISREQHSRSAEAALQSVLLLESLLQRMELAILHETFHREQLAAICLH